MRWSKSLTLVEAHAEGEVGRLGETTVAGRPTVLPRIAGRGWIHGIHQIDLDPSDPYPQGFPLSDCWGDAFDLLR